MRVDMPRCRAIAWYARKINDIVSIKKIALGGIEGKVLGDAEGVDSCESEAAAAVFFREGTVQV